MDDNKSSYVFEFVVEDSDGDEVHSFRENLFKEKCGSLTKDNTPCERPTVIGLGVCWQHMEKLLYLRIKDEPPYGKGLYAQNRSLGENDRSILYPKDETIAYYNGEDISKREMNRRYGSFTPPYGIDGKIGPIIDIKTGKRRTIKVLDGDGALKRGIGTMANHTSADKANARFQFVKDGGKDVIGLVATKNIRNYDPVHVNYGAAYNLTGKYAGGLTATHTTSWRNKNYLYR